MSSKPRKQLVSFKRLGYSFGFIGLGLTLFYLWQPMRVDWVQRKLPEQSELKSITEIGFLDSGKKVLLITAHPDDEAYYLGGTLFTLKDHGIQAKLIVLTNGDKGYYPFFDSDTLAATRQKETRESASRVGIQDVEFYSLRDGRLKVTNDVIDKVADAIKEFKPDFVLGFDHEYPPRVSHGDHRRAGTITYQAVQQAGFRGWLLQYSTITPNMYLDVTERWPVAQELLSVHKSQFGGKKLKNIEAAVQAYAIETAAETERAVYAEGFRAVNLDRTTVARPQ